MAIAAAMPPTATDMRGIVLEWFMLGLREVSGELRLCRAALKRA
jgi:hypothetical protein